MWKDFKWEGRGKLVLADGKRFDGNFKKGLKHGHGKLIAKSGSLLKEGCWFEGLQISEGKPDYNQLKGNIESRVIAYKNGDQFEGNLIEFEKEGLGTYLYS